MLAALALVALLAHVGGLVARLCRQPSVVGQIAAGVLAGPSVLGAVVPRLPSVLYGPDVLPDLHTVAELGVTFFILQVGHELAAHGAPAGTRTLLSLASIGVLVPFTLGAAVALCARQSLAPPGAGLLSFVGFLGLALSATALPVLARILAEQRAADTPLGSLALGAAACTDALLWVGVAALSAGHGDLGASDVAGLVLAAGGAVVLPLRRAVARRAAALAGARPELVLTVLVVAVLLVGTASAAVLGHPGIGALACGVALPAGIPALDRAMRHLRTVTEALLLPVFFAVIGLSVRVDAVGGGGLVLLAVVLTVAFTGKLGGCALAARAQGLPWPPALRFGVLMNCRGATELVLLNIGVSLGLVGERLYAVLVVLALLSTALTGPLLRLLPGGGLPPGGVRRDRLLPAVEEKFSIWADEPRPGGAAASGSPIPPRPQR